ncbi:MAG: agmatinase [Candidatus Marinimicrobia bacterium]|nr:agmatinase [Candidatus Neomarinimicrobiota bacterium]
MLRQDQADQTLSRGDLALLGIPFDENSSFMRGSAEAPGRIRDALFSGASNLCTESGHDLSIDTRFHDAGDVHLSTPQSAFQNIEQAVTSLTEKGVHILALGGDHSITYPVVKATARVHPPFSILHLDAHPDLYDEYDGNRYSHASPFARIMEEGLVQRLVQVGIRTANPHQREQAERFGVEIIEMKDWRPEMTFEFDGPLYVSLDMDVLDPAFAPGVSHHEPGGLSTRDVITIIQSLNQPIIGAEIVEVNPRRDYEGITAMTAAKLAKELAAKILH